MAYMVYVTDENKEQKKKERL